jgi:CheY-like chemotaxis protein
MSAMATVDVLLVEDDLADVLMIQEALADWRIPTRLHIAGDGAEAIAFLRQEGNHADAPRPALVLLEVDMPRTDGFAVLTDVKGDEGLMAIPVVVFSTSTAAEDVRRGYAARANAYVVKPASYEEFARVVRSIARFYAEIAIRPAMPQLVDRGTVDQFLFSGNLG